MQAVILTFMIPVIALIFTGVFFALWWSDRSKTPVLAFSFCYLSIALGVALNIWLAGSMDAFGIVAYHLLAMAGMISLMWGSAQRAEVKAPIALSAISVLIVTPILWLAVTVGAIDAMKMAQNTNSALIMSLIAMTLWYGTKRNWADHALIWVLIATASFGFIRPMLTVFAVSLDGPTGQWVDILRSIHVLVLATLLTLMALSLIASIAFERMKSDQHDATIDPMTGLPNRAAFERQASGLLRRAISERIPVSLIIGDIDHFKRVNDNFGHSAGDAVIAAFAGLIAKKIRPGDIAGRFGGEEFCIVAWNCDEEGACALADRLRHGFAQMTHEVLPDSKVTTASFGVAEVYEEIGYANAFERADTALYAAKRSGRNCVIGQNVGEFTGPINDSVSNSISAGPASDNSAEIVDLSARQVTKSS